MKKQLIATLVGGIILFVWQFLSWSMLGVHKDEFMYTPNQDTIMANLTQTLGKEGIYMLPNVPPGTSHEEHERLMEGFVGKPWASVAYHESFEGNMGIYMARAFSADLLALFLLVWLLLKFANLNFKTTLLASLAVGGIGYLTTSYLNSIWFETNSMGHLIDTVAQWGLAGAWLGWWLNRR
ncbi:MAG: hypothetical protein ACKVU2_11360 [Saprospiraceae bacterium]